MQINRREVKIEIDETLDAVIFGKLSREAESTYVYTPNAIRPGGVALYAASTCSSCNFKVALVTKLLKADDKFLRNLYGKSTQIFSHYDELAQDVRKSVQEITPTKDELITRCLTQNSPFTTKDIPNVKAYSYVFPEGIYGDYTIDLIKECSKLGKVYLDASAFLNKIEPKLKLVSFHDHGLLQDLAPYCELIKITQEELERLTNNKDLMVSMKTIQGWGAKEILVTDKNSLYLLDAKGNFVIERIAEEYTLNCNHLDVSTLITYAIERITSDPISSLYTAGAVSMAKLNRPGPIRTCQSEIDHNLKFFYYYKPVQTIEPIED